MVENVVLVHPPVSDDTITVEASSVPPKTKFIRSGAKKYEPLTADITPILYEYTLDLSTPNKFQNEGIVCDPPVKFAFFYFIVMHIA